MDWYLRVFVEVTMRLLWLDEIAMYKYDGNILHIDSMWR